MFQDLVIFQKVYDLILWLYPAVNKFPKSQRFVLGQQIENTVLEILKGIIQANQERNKLPYLKQISKKKWGQLYFFSFPGLPLGRKDLILNFSFIS